jgi:hypothetical protein
MILEKNVALIEDRSMIGAITAQQEGEMISGEKVVRR